MKCRGHETRIQICKENVIEPVAHLMLLSGRVKRSDAEAEIKNDYYIFQCTHKLNGTKEIIQCGMGAATDFLKILNKDGIPIFNPLLSQGNVNTTRRKSFAGNKEANEKWNPAAKQLYDAIMLLIIEWDDHNPDSLLFSLKEEITEDNCREPQKRKIKAVNTIISKDSKKRTLSQIVSDMKKDDAIKEFCFDLLEKILLDEYPDIVSNF